MKKLVAFGDSWTHGHGVEDDPAFKEIGIAEEFITNLRICNSWPRYLADRLDLPFLNFGYPGASNVMIESIIDRVFGRLTPRDLIVVMLTFPYRHEKHGTPEDIKIVIERLQRKLEGYDYYFVNSFCPTFEFDPEVKDQLDLSRFLQVDRTAADILKEYEKEHDVSVWEYGNRKVYWDKKNFTEGDYHPNILGYKVIASWLHEELKKKQQANDISPSIQDDTLESELPKLLYTYT